jgi:hypothetical protein
MEPVTTRLRARLQTLALGLVGAAGALLAGCAPHIGDHCAQNTDCGSTGTLVCDTSLPNGYCTQFNCTANVCQNSATCVAFEPSVPGCPYDDYQAPSRTNRTFCMAHCNHDSDCRHSEGYICADPTKPPWSAAIVDDNQSQLVCIPAFSPGTVRSAPDGGLPEGSVCSASGPAFDASLVFPGEDAGADAPSDGSADGFADGAPDGADAGPEAGADAGPDAPADAPSEGPPDASTDGSADASADAPGDGATDAGAADAPDGG